MSFADANLEAGVRDFLGISDGPISAEQMASVRNLYIREEYLVGSLDGLQCAVGLEGFSIGAGTVEDLSPLTDLRQLETVHVTGNVSDLSPLAGLDNLWSLGIHQGSVTDLSPIEGLTNLVYLYVSDAEVADIGPLRGLVNLTHLELADNAIVDVDALRDLQLVQNLSIRNNEIEDISPLGDMLGLRHLDARRNRILDVAPLGSLPNIQLVDLSDNQVTDIIGLVGGAWEGSDPPCGDIFLHGNPLTAEAISTQFPEVCERLNASIFYVDEDWDMSQCHGTCLSPGRVAPWMK